MRLTASHTRVLLPVLLHFTKVAMLTSLVPRLSQESLSHVRAWVQGYCAYLLLLAKELEEEPALYRGHFKESQA